MKNNKQVLVIGATGNVGGATAKELLKRGWQIRAFTRNKNSSKALSLATQGAELFEGNIDDKASLKAAISGIKKVFCVLNPRTSGNEGEIRQGKLIADVAKEAGINHLVFSSAGTGENNTGVPHFQNKIEIETYMKKLRLPLSIIRPGPFMELLTNKQFFPPLVSWGVEPKVLGWNSPKPWVAVRDVGIVAANIFENPKKWIGNEVLLYGDVKSLSECKSAYISTFGKKPTSIPIPVWLFKKIVGTELVLMWEWFSKTLIKIGPQELWDTVDSSRVVCPELLDLESWMSLRKSLSIEQENTLN